MFVFQDYKGATAVDWLLKWLDKPKYENEFHYKDYTEPLFFALLSESNSLFIHI